MNFHFSFCPVPSNSSSQDALHRPIRRSSLCCFFTLLVAVFALRAMPTALFAQKPTAEDPFLALVRPTDALTPEEERTKLKVPQGFEVQLFASEPMINKPINMAFDQRGRLWVSSTTEYPFPAPKERWEDALGSRVRDSLDAIKILEDTDGDGRADKVTDFATGLNIPIGVLPYGKGCIAWSIPNIWYLEDTDGDGKCDKQTVLFGPLGYERDTHGNIASLRMGQDGWVYATHGFNNTSRFVVAPEQLGTRKAGDPGTVLELSSGNVFRFRPDGSAIEPWTNGQTNPFGSSFDAWGQLYSADCHSDPITQLVRGCTYPSYRMAVGPLGYGPTMCPQRHGSTGLCGLVYVERGIWGPEWDDHMLLGNCVTSRINHDHVTFTGASAHANEQPDFLISEDPWFRPVDLQFGPDHALYVADFYNKIIGHYEVDRKHPGRDRTSGRIWRIVRKGIGPVQPRALTAEEAVSQKWRWQMGAKENWEPETFDIALRTLEDGRINPRVRRTVLEQVGFRPRVENLPRLLPLLEMTPADDPAMQSSLRVALKNHLAEQEAFAVLDRVAPQPSRELLLIARAVDTEESAGWLLRWLQTQTAVPKDLPDILRAIARRLPAAQQGAFVALMREKFARTSASPLELLQAISQGSAIQAGTLDPQVVVWAWEVADGLLREIEQDSEPSWTVVPNPKNRQAQSPWSLEVRKCADGKTARMLTSLAPTRGSSIKEQTGTLASKGFICPPTLSFWICGHRGRLAQPAHDLNFVRLVDTDSREELTRAYPPRGDIAQPIEWNLASSSGRSVRLEIVDGDDGGTAYASLAFGRLEPAVLPIELVPHNENLAAVADLTGSFRLGDLAPRLAAQLRRHDLRDDTLVALVSALARFPGQEEKVAAVLRDVAAPVQTKIAEILVSTVEGARQLLLVAPSKLVAAPGVQQKVAALNAPYVVAEFRQRAAAAAPPSGAIDQLIAKRIAGYQAARAAGKLNAVAGEVVFNSICIACHQIGGKGALIGPALDGARNRGVEHLLEDILDPSRAVDPAFRLQVIALKDNSIVTGMLRREEGATLVVADTSGQEKPIAKADVLHREESPLSLMPAGLGDALPEGSLYNLLAWLMTK